jgi:hypothetical protein
MGRRPRLFLPLTVTFFEDDRIIEAGDGPTLLYLAMCLRCKVMGTDGRLQEIQIGRLNRPRWRTELARLATLGLVVRDEVTKEWCIAAWFGHNESLADIDARRTADRERKAADSRRNPGGTAPDSALRVKGSEGKEEEGNPRGVHAFEHDGDGNCVVCRLPHDSRFHLRIVGESA